MTPGLANGPPFPTKAKKGAIVAVASLDSPSVPLIVGVAEIDISDLQQVQGVKGHAVQTMSWLGDQVWSWSSSGQGGKDAPAEIEEWLKDEDVDEVQEATKKLAIQDDETSAEGGVALQSGASTRQNLKDTVEEVNEEERVWTTKGMYSTTNLPHKR